MDCHERSVAKYWLCIEAQMERGELLAMDGASLPVIGRDEGQHSPYLSFSRFETFARVKLKRGVTRRRGEIDAGPYVSLYRARAHRKRIPQHVHMHGEGAVDTVKIRDGIDACGTRPPLSLSTTGPPSETTRNFQRGPRTASWTRSLVAHLPPLLPPPNLSNGG